MDDLLIRNGAILDGSGRDAFAADLAIKDGRIVAVAAGHGAGARRTIDAQGLVVAPGFIDIKTHSDFTLPYAPRAESKVCQGVTTDEGLAAGALGLSSGLFTAPGSFAHPDELLDLVRLVRHRGGTYATHLRNEAGGVFDAVREAVYIAEQTEVHVQMVHLKLSGLENRGQAPALLAEIEAARRRGARVDCDVYPYTCAGNPLRNLLPLWVQEGGVQPMLQRLEDPERRRRIAREIDEQGLTSFGRIASWEAVTLSTSRRRSADAGRSIASLASQAGIDPIDLVHELLAGDGGATYVVVCSIDEADVQALLSSPAVLVGSDGRSVAADSVAGQGRPHPRFYGTFPRVLGRYARDLGLLSVPEAVRKMTGRPAEILGLVDRGFLREGYRADITIFDPATVADRATYEEPHRYPIGISTVIVNGTVVVDSGQHTGALPGRVLRRGSLGVA